MPKHVFDEVVITGSLNGSSAPSPGTGNGTVGTGVTQSTTGDANSKTTTLTLTNVPITIGDNASLAVGVLIYTFPAGVHALEYGYMNVGLTATDVANQADTPEIGIGTVIGSGASATLSGSAEDILAGNLAADANGATVVRAAAPEDFNPLISLSGDDKTVYLNAAAAWSNGTVQTATVSGTVVFHWTKLA